MEFVVVTHHEHSHSCQTGLKDMSILSIPDALLVYTGCRDKLAFAQSIVHISFGFDYMPQLTAHKYCSVNGTLVFRHAISFRTAILTIVSEKILLPSGQMYCINKINNIAWQDDDEVCSFLGILEAKIRLGVVRCTEVTRNDMHVYAVAVADVVVSERVKHSLKFLRCEFGVNAAYKDADGTRTCRSVLFPDSLLTVDPISHTGVYSILSMKPNMTHILASVGHKDAFGVDDEGETRVDFEEYIAKFHTASEMQRIKREVMPIMGRMEAGDVISPIIEFATPRGLLHFEVVIRNIGRSCMAVTFSEYDKPS